MQQSAGVARARQPQFDGLTAQTIADTVPSLSADLGDQLRHRFALAARHHAHRTVAAYHASSDPDFYLHAGTALELAVKARLVRQHGVHCIAPDERGRFAMIALYETKGIDHAKAKTISATEALGRLRQLEQTLPEVFSTNVAETPERRNTGAHAGHPSAPSSQDFLSLAAAFVRAIDVLLTREREEFWGDLAGLAFRLVEDESSAVRVRVQASLAQSKKVVQTLPRDAFAALEAAAMKALDDEGPDVVAVKCPACGAMGGGVACWMRAPPTASQRTAK